jgi:hypothetical protein
MTGVYDEELLRRLRLLMGWHRAGELGSPCDCAAYGEGLPCCIEALYDDEVWQRVAGSAGRR